MGKKKLNNMLNFKEHSSLDKLSNKPGKLLESESKAIDKIMEHPIRKKIYEGFLNNNEKEKADKYVTFWRKNTIAIPEWDEDISDFIDTNKK